MSDAPINYYEVRLQQEIEQIDSRIRDLVKEKEALQRQLMKARRESTIYSDVNRKNSVTRVMIERRILDALKAAKKPLTSSALYKESLYVNFQMKEASFRTILHRMKQKGLILPGGIRGTWKLPEASPA